MLSYIRYLEKQTSSLLYNREEYSTLGLTCTTHGSRPTYQESLHGCSRRQKKRKGTRKSDSWPRRSGSQKMVKSFGRQGRIQADLFGDFIGCSASKLVNQPLTLTKYIFIQSSEQLEPTLTFAIFQMTNLITNEIITAMLLFVKQYYTKGASE